MFTTPAGTVKGRTLRRDGRIALPVDVRAPPCPLGVMTVTAQVSEDPASVPGGGGSIVPSVLSR